MAQPPSWPGGAMRSPALSVPVQLMPRDFPREGISVDAEDFRRPALISLGLCQRSLDKLLFKNTDSFVEKNSFFNHLGNQQFQFFSHGRDPLSCMFAPPCLN